MKLLRILSLMIIACSCVGLYSMDAPPKSFDVLPNELIQYLAQNLSLPDLAHFARTNRRMHAICSKEMQRRPLYRWKQGNIVEKRLDKKEVSVFKVSPDGSFIVTGNENGYICIWNPITGELIRKWNAESTVWGLAISSDGSFIVTEHKNGSICIWNLETGNLIRKWNTGNTESNLAISPDSSFIVTGHKDGSICIWNLETGNLIRKWNTKGIVCKLVISPNNSFIVTSHVNDMRIWNIATGELIREGNTDSCVWDLAISPDGKCVFTGNYENGLICIWNLATGKLIRELESRWVRSLAISPDGSFLILVSDSYIRIHNLAAGQFIREWNTGSFIFGLAISPDSSFIATGHKDGSIRIWHPETEHANC